MLKTVVSIEREVDVHQILCDFADRMTLAKTVTDMVIAGGILSQDLRGEE